MANSLTAKPRALELVNKKFLICVTLSFFAALGTLTYGYQFAKQFQMQNTTLIVYLGAIFAVCAMLANMMLGTYSLMNIKSKTGHKINFYTLVFSFVGAIPYGFLCSFGYQNILPSSINILVSTIVVLVNTGIGYTAIENLKQNLKTTFKKQFTAKSIVPLLGFCIGFAISLMTYLAASSGITALLLHYHQTTLVNYNAGFILAIFSWLPCAALFANANQIVAAELYAKIADFKKFLGSINKTNLILLIFCLCSGTAVAQMTASSFAPTKLIPEFFKTDIIQMLVHYLIPIALLSSAALNYFSLNKFFDNLKESSD